MRLTIIVPDNTICKDGACIINVSWQGAPSNVRALQWYDNHGEIEFKNGLPNEAITELPDWANNAVTAWETAKAYLDEQKQNSPEFSQKEKNKFTASGLLYQTDWTTIPDVSDSTKSNPYLTNVQDFLNFRNTVRAVAINPPETPFDFPPIPKAQWSGS